jgi:hypothetical protein
MMRWSFEVEVTESGEEQRCQILCGSGGDSDPAGCQYVFTGRYRRLASNKELFSMKVKFVRAYY